MCIRDSIALVMSLGYYFVIRNMGALKYTSGAGQQTRDGGVAAGPVGNDRGEDQKRDTVADTLVVDLLTTPGDQLRTCGKGGNDDNLSLIHISAANAQPGSAAFPRK